MALCIEEEVRHGERQSWVPWPRDHPWSGLCWEGRAGIWVGDAQVLPSAPSLAAAGFPALAAWHGGGTSALMLLLGYLWTPNSVSCLVEDTFSYQVLL